MLSKTKSLWVILFLFASAFSATAQETNLSGQAGDILRATSFTGSRKILFIAIRYPDQSGIVTIPELEEHAALLKPRLERNAYGSLSLTIDVVDQVLLMPNEVAYYQNFPSQGPQVRIRADAAKMAEQAGYDVDSYDREIIFSKQIWNGAAGLGTMNKRTILMSEFNANLPYVTAHEVGHSLGWRHANFWEVDGGSPISSNGTQVEYGDAFDMMGNYIRSGQGGPFAGPYHHFNPWLKYRVGWIPEESVLNVTTSGAYTIQALDSAPQSGSVTKYTALKIKKDPLSDYWIFFRSKEELVDYGPVITQNFNDNIRPMLLLDMTPGSQAEDWRDAALAVNSTFSDTQAEISVKTVSVDSSEVEVEVTLDENTLANMDNLPVIDVTSPSSELIINGVVDYEVTAFDPDFGSTNGAGIDKVKLYLHRFTDPLIQNLRRGFDPPNPSATIELSAPPYRWQFDTTSLVDDAIYCLVPQATSTDGGTQTVWFEHFIDNFGLPAAPALSFPNDNATGVSTAPAFFWSASGGTSYRLQVSTESSFSTTVFDRDDITSTSISVPGLENNTTYFWRVNATNAIGTSPWSSVWQFTTIVAVPAATTLSLPADNATDIPTNPTLVWNASPGATSYQLQISTEPDFSTLELDESGIAATSFQAESLSNSTTHYWRVRASNSGGTSPWSSVWQFTTIPTAPAAPTLASPTDNTTDTPTNPTLDWEAADRATSYQLQVSTQSDFLTTVIDESGITATSRQVTDLSNETTYFWRVNATNAGGTSPWSSIWQFTTEQVTSIETGEDIPKEFSLAQNYPNPFNPSTKIEFELPKTEHVTLKIYSITGKEIATIVSSELPAGKHAVTFDAIGLASGVYVYKLQTSSFVQARKMLLVR